MTIATPPSRAGTHRLTASLACIALALASSCGRSDRTARSTGPAPSDAAAQVDASDIAARLAMQEKRTRYPVITPAVLAAIPDAELEEALIDHVTYVLIKGRYDDDLAIVGRLSPGYRMLYATWLLEGEVNNGGFAQFFSNSSGRFAAEALAGCRLLGATTHAALLEQAIAIQASSTDLDALDPLDERFFTLSLSPQRIRYIRAHPEEFASP